MSSHLHPYHRHHPGALYRQSPRLFSWTVLLWILLAAGLWGCTADQSPPPVLGTLEQQRLELTAVAAEPLVELAVREGQAVAAGDLLARLDSRRQQAQLQRIRADMDAARQFLEELESGPRQEVIQRTRSRLDGARSRLQQSEKALRRTRTLVERELHSPATLDRAQAEFDSAKSEVNTLEAQLVEQLAGTRHEQIAQARARWQAIQADYQRALVDLERLEIRAPVAGTVDHLPYHEGEHLRVGDPVVVLLDTSRTYARVYLPPTQRRQLAPGSAAQITLHPHSDGATTLPGSVHWISPDAAFTPFFALNRHERDNLVYLAEVDIVASAAASPRLAVGLPVSVTFPSRHHGTVEAQP